MNRKCVQLLVLVTLIGYCGGGRAASNWAITSPGWSPIEEFLDYQTITVNAGGSGTPGALCGCRAFSEKQGGGQNEGVTAAGNFSYSYPQPALNLSSDIVVGGSNSWHKKGVNTLTWKANDYADGTGWLAKDTVNVLIKW
jgi:hypothetical protein